jgi:hypothetical protein
VYPSKSQVAKVSQSARLVASSSEINVCVAPRVTPTRIPTARRFPSRNLAKMPATFRLYASQEWEVPDHAGSRQVARVVMLSLKNLVPLDFNDDPRAPRGSVRTCGPEFSRPVRT